MHCLSSIQKLSMAFAHLRLHNCQKSSPIYKIHLTRGTPIKKSIDKKKQREQKGRRFEYHAQTASKTGAIKTLQAPNGP
jgi:hypothetical protein